MPYRVNEAQTRYSLIDQHLRRAGWNISDHLQVGTEIPIAPLQPQAGGASAPDFSRGNTNEITAAPTASAVYPPQEDIAKQPQPPGFSYSTAEKIELFRMKVAPLLRFVSHVKPADEFFTSKMERCGLALLQKKDLKTHIESIREDVELLPPILAKAIDNRKWFLKKTCYYRSSFHPPKRSNTK